MMSSGGKVIKWLTIYCLQLPFELMVMPVTLKMKVEVIVNEYP